MDRFDAKLAQDKRLPGTAAPAVITAYAGTNLVTVSFARAPDLPTIPTRRNRQKP